MTGIAVGVGIAAAAAAGIVLLDRTRGHRPDGPGTDVTYGAALTHDGRALAERLAAPSTADIRGSSLRDDTGHGLDTLKVIDRPGGGYLGVSHTTVDGVFQTRVSTSDDLVNWKLGSPLGNHASQPSIRVAPDGSFVVAWEVDSRFGNHVKVAQYDSEDDLLAGRATREFDARRTLGRNEGTPSIDSITIDPDGQLRIEMGIHYYRREGFGHAVDRQARATLVGFRDWSAHVDEHVNDAFEQRGFSGNLGDRDTIEVNGHDYTMVEVQQRYEDFSSWGIELLDHDARRITPLDVRTTGGSRSIANPTVSAITMPDGRPGMVASYFIFGEGAAEGEGGTTLAAWHTS